MASSERTLRRWSKGRRAPRGQATLEYSLVAHAMLALGTVFLMPILNQLLNAITLFYTSVYTVIQTAAI
jgi:hypothetical protein